MIKSIVLDDKEFVIANRNLGLCGKSNLIDAVAAMKEIRKHKRPKDISFNCKIEFDNATYYCKNEYGIISEGMKGDIEYILDFFANRVVIFKDENLFNLKELAFSDNDLVIDLFAVMDLEDSAKPAFFNFVQELSSFLGDTLTDYNKALAPMRTSDGKYCISCLNYDNYEITQLNQEPERIKRVIRFICNTLKITDKTEAVFIDNFSEKDFKLNNYALSISFDDPNIQYIFTSEDVIDLKKTTKYLL